MVRDNGRLPQELPVLGVCGPLVQQAAGEELEKYLAISHAYAKTLRPKPTKKKS
jgi:hypothetical protein